VLLAIVGDWNAVNWLSSYFGSYEPMDARAAVKQIGLALAGGGELPARFLMLYVALPVALILPPTLLMGASFPLLLKAVQTDLARLGRSIGGLLTANIAGSALGSIVTGWMSLAWLGSSGTLRMLVVVGALFPVCGLMLSFARPHRRRAWWYLASVAASVLLFAVMPGGASLWATFHGSTPAFVDVGEDGSGTSVLRTVPGREPSVVVFANGVGQSWIPYGGIHTVLGALPAFVHPHPRTAAVIGLGSGDTLFGLAGRPELERITCVEIIRPQLETLNRLSGAGRDPLRSADRARLRRRPPAPETRAAPLRHHRSRCPAADQRVLGPPLLGRLFCADSRSVDAGWPRGDLVADRARAQHLPLGVSARPQLRGHRPRLDDPRARAYYGRAVVDIVPLLAPYLDRAPRVYGPADDRSHLADINTDLFPKDEFSVPLK
jgi:hypothetical protein